VLYAQNEHLSGLNDTVRSHFIERIGLGMVRLIVVGFMADAGKAGNADFVERRVSLP
jgi:hypothetical protein